MSKGKNKASEAPTEQEQTPEQIGLHGTVDDFNAAIEAAEKDLADKESAWKKSSTAFFITPKKAQAVREAYYAAREVPNNICQGFQQGACDAFLNNRPDNIQYILSNPEGFVRQYTSPAEDFFYDDILITLRADRLVSDTLISLLDKSADPDTVLDKALKNVAEDKRQDILDSTLLSLVNQQDIDIAAPVSALLKASAKASSEVLAIALHKDDRAADMLIKSGAKIDEALQIMYKNRKYYGDTPEKIEALQRKDDEINKLKETIAELTTRQESQHTAPATLAETPAPRRISKLPRYN